MSEFNLRNFNARGDGITLDTHALQRAIDAAAQCGGGTVFVPAGRYVIGSIVLRDHITLYLDAGAVLV
ncbi:MAG: glycoside hydrolase family 28 protein, partial [Anaerolineae bacterium]|nr:glycoside hydrolase family 28 protein [Anaerolineae bacterium]